MDCPRCQTQLKPDKLSEAAITYSAMSCPTCRGFWVTDEQLKTIEMDELAVLVEFRNIPGDEAQREPLSCPECRRTMEKIESARDERVIVDLCRSCGKAWLDGGEIAAIKNDSLLATVGHLFRWARSGKTAS